jgi:glycosyltransferase involved in cell wall biosynthesis
MRILQVVSLLNPDGAYGGPARVALNTSAEIIRRGHDVTVAAATRGYPVGSSTLDGVPVELFDARMLMPTNKFYGMGAPDLSRWFRANGRDYDVVHIHFARDLVVLPIAMSARRQRIPYVLQTHGMVIPSQHPLSAPLDVTCTRRALHDAGAVCYLTAQEKGQLTTVAGSRLRLFELGNGVPEYAGPPRRSGPPEVLFAARLASRKKPLAFVAMARMLLTSGQRACFTLLGPDGGQGSAVTAATVAHPSINWDGAVEPSELPARMAAANVFVLPSVREPYPMAVLEAMSVGLPVVVTDDCGLAPMVDRTGCGIVTDPSPPSLAAAVGKLLHDESLAADMGRRGREVARSEFSMSAIGDRLELAYSRVAEGAR